MKAVSHVAALVLLSVTAYAQGTFVYDQQSADENQYLEGGYALGQQPLGQSFTPSLDAVGFIRIYVSGGSSGTFLMNLRSDSIIGTILGTSSPLSLTLGGASTFVFPAPVTVTPGTTYYFQPVIQSSVGGYGTFVAAYNYSGGMAFVDGL